MFNKAILKNFVSKQLEKKAAEQAMQQQQMPPQQEQLPMAQNGFEAKLKYAPGGVTAPCPPGKIYSVQLKKCVSQNEWEKSDWQTLKNTKGIEGTEETLQTIFDQNKNYREQYEWMKKYHNSPRYKEMLRNSSAKELEEELGRVPTEDEITNRYNYYQTIRDENLEEGVRPLVFHQQTLDEHGNLTTTGGYSKSGHGHIDASMHGLSEDPLITKKGQIVMLPQGLNTALTNIHEISHTTDIPRNSFEDWRRYIKDIDPQAYADSSYGENMNLLGSFIGDTSYEQYEDWKEDNKYLKRDMYSPQFGDQWWLEKKRVMPSPDHEYIAEESAQNLGSSRKYHNDAAFKKAYENATEEEKKAMQRNYQDFYSKYVAKGTETRARLNSIRNFFQTHPEYGWDPFKEELTEQKYHTIMKQLNKDLWNKGSVYEPDSPGFDPLWQLQNVFHDDNIIEMLNTISRQEPSQTSDFDQYVDQSMAKMGGLSSSAIKLSDYLK